MNFIASQAIARSQQLPGGEAGTRSDSEFEVSDAMAALDQQNKTPSGFVPSSTGLEGTGKVDDNQSATTKNPDALDVDLDI